MAGGQVRRRSFVTRAGAWGTAAALGTFGLRPAVADGEKGSLPFGGHDFYDTVRALLRFEVTDDALARIRTPTLVTEYEQESVYPGQARMAYAALRSDKKLVRFTAADGAQLHDAPMAPQRRNEVVFDWLEDRLR